MVASDFGSEVSRMRNEKYAISFLFMAESPNFPFRIFKEIGAEEHEADVRFQTASRYMAILLMCNE